MNRHRALDEQMAGKKSDPSPASIARADRQRLTFEEGVRAMAEIEHEAAAVRKNMERLRALRQAKEAEELRTEASSQKAPAKTTRKKRFSR
jgi:hypothetical protein